MKISLLSINSLTPYEQNPRKNERAVQKVLSSIKEFGFQQPIVIDKDNVIVCGHTRYVAAKELGLKEVPVVVAEDLSEAQIKAYRIADNKTADFSEWDEQLLKLELEDLEGLDFDLNLTGFDQSELDELLSQAVEGVSDSPTGESVPNENTSKKGDVWLLGDHRLVCGESTFKDNTDTLTQKEKSDLVFIECDIIIMRWQQFTGKDAILEVTRETYNSINEKRKNE